MNKQTNVIKTLKINIKDKHQAILKHGVYIKSSIERRKHWDERVVLPSYTWSWYNTNIATNEPTLALNLASKKHLKFPKN